MQEEDIPLNKEQRELQDEEYESNKPAVISFLRQQEVFQQSKGEDKVVQKGQEKIKSEKIYIYFCSICGKKAIMANIGLDSLPNRRADNTIAINMQQVFLQNFLIPEEIKYIKRPTTIEKQYRLKCEECGVFIAYLCITYDEAFQILTKPDEKQVFTNRPYLYVLNDALVINQQFSKLYQEVARLKDQLII